jgi:hypothetical protein
MLASFGASCGVPSEVELAAARDVVPSRCAQPAMHASAAKKTSAIDLLNQVNQDIRFFAMIDLELLP